MAKKKKNTKGKKTMKKSSKPKATSKASGGKEAGRWNNHTFTISPKLIRGFTDLQIKGSCELQNKKKSKQGYAKRKGGNPTEITLTIILNAYTGCDVRKEAMAFVSEARDGKQDYFYTGNKKLTSCKLMLTAANVKEVEISPKGTWINAKVSLTMKQSNKGSGSSSKSGKKKTKKKSVKSTAPVQSYGSGYSSSASTSSSSSTKSTTAKKKPATFGTVGRAIKKGPTLGHPLSPTKAAIKAPSRLIGSAKAYTNNKKR